MSAFFLPVLYLRWHYTRGIRDFFGIWINLLWFVGNLFSVRTLLMTLIQPLKLIQEEKGSLISDPAEYAQNLLVNVIMRIVGMVTRTALVLVALMLWVLILLGGTASFLLWLILPWVLVVSIVTGVALLT